MLKGKLFIFIVGSVLFGVIAMLGLFGGLIAGGVIDFSPRTLVISSGSAERDYNGDALTCDEWEILDGELKDGHSVKVVFTGTQTTVGATPNSFVVGIFDGNGADVTDKYIIQPQYGALVVNPRSIEFATPSLSKTYDGKPLSSTDFSVSNGSLVYGHTVEASITGSQTVVGSSINNISVIIRDSSGKDVSNNYRISYSVGNLEVTKRHLLLTSLGGSKIYDGAPLFVSEFEITEGEMPTAHNVVVDNFTSITDVGSIANTFVATVFDENGADVSQNYEINYLYGTLQIAYHRIEVASQKAEKIYDGTPLVKNGANDWWLTDDTLKNGHYLEVEITGVAIDAGSEDNTFNVKVCDAYGNDVTVNYIIDKLYGKLVVKKRPIILSSATAEKVYDGTPLSDDTVTIVSGNLVGEHRIETTNDSAITEVGTTDNAFIAAIVDGENDVTNNYDVTVSKGNLTVTKRQITFSSETLSKVYDGVAYDNLSADLTDGSLVEGHTTDVTNDTYLLDVGEIDNEFSVVIRDQNGENVSKNYAISITKGTLSIEKRAITLASETVTKVYDGQVLARPDLLVTYGSLVFGHSLDTTNDSSLLNVGSKTNDYLTKILDADGFDVTKNYDVTIVKGILTITARPLFLSSATASKTYDGVALELKNVHIDEGSVASGQTLDVVNNSSITNVGSIPNAYSAVIRDDQGNNVTANYTIAHSVGTLTINARAITMRVADASKIYDGTPLTTDRSDVEIVDGTIAPSQYWDVNCSKLTDVGVKTNDFIVYIEDANGRSVVNNYEITRICGDLTVEKRAVTASSASSSKVYDGTPLTDERYTLSDNPSDLYDGLIAGHSYLNNLVSSITNIGNINNVFDLTILDQNGQPVTQNYAINYQFGNLEVLPINITVKTQGAVKVYDGTPLKKDTDFQVLIGSLAYGDELRVVEESVPTVTNVDDVDNNIIFEVYDTRTGNNVTANYRITVQAGILSVTHRNLVIKTPQYSKVYDGLPYRMSAEQAQILNLVVGHELIDLQFKTVGPVVGNYANDVVNYTVLDAVGNDVTNNYTYSGDFGNIIISQRPITVRSGSETKDYDGTPLTCDTFEVISVTQPIDGHSLTVQICGERTLPGESPNTIAEVIVRDEALVDVTINYSVKTVEGYLIVRDEGTLDNPDDINNLEKVMMRVTADTSGAMYLRNGSYGDYTGNQWMSAPIYTGNLIDGTYGMNYMTSVVLQQIPSLSANTVTIQNLTTMHVLPYYLTLDGAAQTNDTIFVNTSGTDTYTASYYQFDYVQQWPMTTLYKFGANADVDAYTAFVYLNYLQVPSSTTEYLEYIISSNGFVNTDNRIIQKVADFVASAAVYDLEYDKNLDNESDVVLAFLNGTYESGVCRHFAAAATMLFRALGIPARYTVGYLVQTVAGNEVEVKGKDGHAWVEVFVDDIGWVQVEVTGSSNNVADKTDIRIIASNFSMEYDGVNTLTPTNKVTWSFASDFDGAGYNVVATVIGSQRDVGTSKSVITDYAIYDPDGHNVTDDFDVTLEGGNLKVYYTRIMVMSGGATKAYDGTPLTCSDYSVDGKIIDGHSLSVSFSGMITLVGTQSNDFDCQIFDSHGNDVTDYYLIDRLEGKLNVTREEIVLVAASATKVYDGLPLTPYGGYVEMDGVQVPTEVGYVMTEGTLATGHTIQVTIYGTQTSIGISESYVERVKILNQFGDDVTSCYVISTEDGILRVKKS